MQIVYLSNRPTVFAETWEHVRHFMPWVDRALVVVPSTQLAAFDALEGVTAVDECEVSGRTSAQLAALDHVRRNVSLRRALLAADGVAADRVDDVFLLSDDDYRPMKPIERSFFGDDDRDVGFHCHDLVSWPGYSTPFDEAQHVTGQVLSYLGAPRRSYGSHLPQIMRLDLWRDAFEVWAQLRDDDMVCEWGWYFNVGQHRHPDRFAPPEPYRTMCWPPHLHEWRLRERPSEYAFENHYPHFYEPGAVFEGLPTRLDPEAAARHSVEKLVRWAELGRRAGRLDFRSTPAEPWTKGERPRQATFGVLRTARKAYDYLAIEEREAISELQGSLDRIERRLDQLAGD